MENYIIIALVAAIVGSALWYIRRKKKQGAKCVGCPHAGTCASCSCHAE